MGVEMALHSMQPVDVHLIFGKIIAQISYGQSITVIWVVVYVQNAFIPVKWKWTAKVRRKIELSKCSEEKF